MTIPKFDELYDYIIEILVDGNEYSVKSLD